MVELAEIAGLGELWKETAGAEEICVAVVDGDADLDHPAFTGASMARLSGPWPRAGFDGEKTRHGTHVASVLFGRHDGPVPGVAPGCCGLVVPVFSDGKSTSQLDLARGIEAAVDAGAHVINLSGGQFSASGEAEDLLRRAVELCTERNVLLVAAAGNDGCQCAHVPAALGSVIAVGGLDGDGMALESSNFGVEYAEHGILAPGVEILGAVPGGGAARATGTSMATPIVSGVAALLLSLQLRRGERPDPHAVRTLLLATADPCVGAEQMCRRYLSGKLNIGRAMAMQENISTHADAEANAVLSCATTHVAGYTAPVRGTQTSDAPVVAAQPDPTTMDVAPALAVTQSAESVKVTWTPLVYALGTLGYDFGTEARRDSFKQLMAPVTIDGSTVPANPYDSRQMVDHLLAHPSEARSLIWTLNLELTPIYALEPLGAYGSEVYGVLTTLLAGEVAAEADADYIERVSIPGRLTDRNVKLFSGQVVPVVSVEQVRGLYGWRVNALIDAALTAANNASGEAQEDAVRGSLREFLTRVYYDLRNLGSTSRDRALNFAATNAFQAAHTFADAIAVGMALDDIDVQKSPYSRMDSDSWDVKLRFFDPENSRRARKVFRFTIDVSDLMPVTQGDMRAWSESGS
ncbi:PatA/PatG family cyanobactin maturation protease [Nocardia sp. NPDC050408]|uniref:PatA/PatG family cyanobactin maturation protease n=1 Tax=unclassified Nocardia TaxID=2637762 RepID=UPI00342EDF26